MKMAQTFEIEWKGLDGTIVTLSEREIKGSIENYLWIHHLRGTVSVRRIDDLHDMPLSTSMEEKL